MNKEKGEFVIKTATGSVDQKPRKKIVPKSQRNSIHLEKNLYQQHTFPDSKEHPNYRIHINLDPSPQVEAKRGSVLLPGSSPRVMVKPSVKEAQVASNLANSPSFLQKKYLPMGSIHKGSLVSAFQDSVKNKKTNGGIYATSESSQSLTELGGI